MSKQITDARNKTKGQRNEPNATSFRAGLREDRTSEHSNQATVPNARNLLPINSKAEFLTPEKLRSFSGCNHYSDEEALAVIESLDTLARIVLGTPLKPGTPIDNQQVLHLDTKIQSYNKAA